MSSSNASVTKITKKPRGSNGSMVYSLGMGGDTAKKTRMAIKSLRRTAAENSARIKGKRVGLIANAERTQVADNKKESSQAREMMQLKQQLAAAEEKLKKKRANEKTLIHMVGELESENAELLNKSKGSDLSDRALSIALGRLSDALTTIEELKADIKRKDEQIKKSQANEYEGKIEQLSEQKSNDSTTGSRNCFRYTNDRHRQPIGINYVMDNESLEYADGYDYGNESPTEF